MRSAYHGYGYRSDTDSDDLLARTVEGLGNRPATSDGAQVCIKGCINVGRILDRQGGSYQL